MVRPTQELEVIALTDLQSLNIGGGVDTGDGGVDLDGGGTNPDDGGSDGDQSGTEVYTVTETTTWDGVIDYATARWWDITLTSDIAITITGAPAEGLVGRLHVVLRQGVGAPFVVTWPASVLWRDTDGTESGSAPTLATVEAALDVLVFTTFDAGTTWGGSYDSVGSTGGNFLTSDTGEQHEINPHGNLGATESFDLATGNVHTGTLDANCTITLTGFTAGVRSIMQVRLSEDGTGGWTPTYAVSGTLVWIGGTTPTHVTTASSITEYVFWSDDGGTIVNGGMVGAGSGTGSALTIKDEGVTLDTAVTSIDFVGAGVTATNVSHAVTVTIPTGADSAAIDALGFVGAILISDTPSTPLVFADLIQNEAQDDLVYADPLP